MVIVIVLFFDIPNFVNIHDRLLLLQTMLKFNFIEVSGPRLEARAETWGPWDWSNNRMTPRSFFKWLVSFIRNFCSSMTIKNMIPEWMVWASLEHWHWFWFVYFNPLTVKACQNKISQLSKYQKSHNLSVFGCQFPTFKSEKIIFKGWKWMPFQV